MYQNGKKLLLLLLILPVFVLGCSKHNPNPELLDPIYLDLKNRVGDLSRDVSTFKGAVKEEQQKKDSAEPGTKDLVLAKKRLRESLVKLERAEQQLKFYEIRLERRKLESRVSYEKAFSADKAWPDPLEFEAYEANKDLRSAKSSWSSRVPKLKDRIKQFNAQQSTKADPKEKSSH